MLQGGGSRTDATDIICPMYARVDECLSLASIPMEHRPVIQCEYAHAMGNSNGNYKVRPPAFQALQLLSSLSNKFGLGSMASSQITVNKR